MEGIMNESEKKSYEKPVLEYCGPVIERTLGSGGTSLDGGCTLDQKGYGNDDNPNTPGSCKKKP
jgi:hypothetical protein